MKLVLIDDEPFHLIGMQTVIPWEQSQFIIAGEARSGEEGIELILREQPDIAIVDIVMPGIDGLEMIRRVKDAAPETRFIVLSCMNDIQRYKEAVSLGAAEYLQKDLATPDVLLETVRRVAQQLKRERLRNSDGEAHADTAPQLRTEYLNLLLSGTAENLRTAPYQSPVCRAADAEQTRMLHPAKKKRVWNGGMERSACRRSVFWCIVVRSS